MMRRRDFLKALGLGGATVALANSMQARAAIGADATASSKIKKPNIVIVLTDDLGFGDLGCYGSPVITTPNLDKFAGEGVKLTHCYSASSNCSPSRAAMLTGRMPYRVGMYDFRRIGSPMHVPTNETSVAKLLQAAGYNTMFAGKWHIGSLAEKPEHPTPGDHGFDYWLANERNFDQNPKSLLRNGQPAGQLEGIQCEIIIREAISWLKTDWNRDKPFCMFLWLNEPHNPVRASDSFKQPYQGEQFEAAAGKVKYGGPGVLRTGPKKEMRPTYFGCVSQMDHEFGRLMKTLDEMKLRDDTFVYFTSDNGPEHRSSASWGSPGDFRGAKGHMHEGGIHVPGLMRWPGRIRPGSVSDLPVNGTDVLPTLCALAGVEPKTNKPIDGANVLPGLLEGKAVTRPKPLFWWMFHARGGKQACMRVGQWKILASLLPQKRDDLQGAKPPAGQSPMEFIKKAKLGEFELFDLKTDPNETTNVASREPEKFERLKKQFVALHKEIQAEGPTWTSVTGGRGK